MIGIWVTSHAGAKCRECDWCQYGGSERRLVSAAKAHSEQLDHTITITRTQGRVLVSPARYAEQQRAARAKWRAEREREQADE